MLELGAARGIPLPGEDAEGLAQAMVAPPGGNLPGYLTLFETTLALLQDAEAVERVAYELALDQHEEDVHLLEVRFGPHLLTRGGMTSREGVAAAWRGLQRATGETGIRCGILLCILRHRPVEEGIATTRLALELRSEGVVGIDLAGPEAGHPPILHRRAFDLAASEELPITIHAGEAAGADSIRMAVEECHARRIGHGTHLFEDPALGELLREREVTLEFCLTSNLQTGALRRLEEHPLRAALATRVPCTLATDNRLISGTNLLAEYALAQSTFALSTEELGTLARQGLAASFIA